MLNIQNKFEKILLSSVGVLLVVVVVLGMKIKNDSSEKERFKEDVKNSRLDEKMFDIQKKIKEDREKVISEIINSPGEKVVEEVVSTTTTPPPPPPVEEVVEKKADKKTKSS